MRPSNLQMLCCLLVARKFKNRGCLCANARFSYGPCILTLCCENWSRPTFVGQDPLLPVKTHSFWALTICDSWDPHIVTLETLQMAFWWHKQANSGYLLVESSLEWWHCDAQQDDGTVMLSKMTKWHSGTKRRILQWISAARELSGMMALWCSARWRSTWPWVIWVLSMNLCCGITLIALQQSLLSD